MNTVAMPNFAAPDLDAEKLARLTRELESLTAAQLYWVAAWSAAQAEQAQRSSPAVVAPAGRLALLNGREPTASPSCVTARLFTAAI